MTDGYIKTFRKLKEWQWYKDAHMTRVFLHLLLSANFRAAQWNGITILPGQLVTSADKIGQELDLGRQVCRTCINRLISTNEITINPTNKYTLITIVNWALYQSSDTDDNQQTNHQSNIQLTINQPSTNHQLTTNKKDKKEKKDIYGEFSKVSLAADEYAKLLERFGQQETSSRIERLDTYIASKGVKYKDHYATIIAWAKKDESEGRMIPLSAKKPDKYRDVEDIRKEREEAMQLDFDDT